MKNRLFLNVLCSVLTAGLLGSCMGMEESDPSSLSVPEMKTFEVNDNGSLVFGLTATVDKSATGRIASCGFYYGKKKDMSDAERIECKMTGNTFAADLTLREYGETFYACSYISNGLGSSEICSDPRTISVGDLEDYVSFEAPVVLSYDRETKTAMVSISCKVQKGVEVSRCGLCYGDSQDLSKSDNYSDDTDFTDMTINAEVLNVEYGQACYVMPYLYDGDVSVYGEMKEMYVYSIPLVEIDDVSQVTTSGAEISCVVKDDCGKSIKSRGVIYIEGDGEPSMQTGKSSTFGSLGEYVAVLSTLSPNTMYSVRAYAENEMGVAYSKDKRVFTTMVALSKVSCNIEDRTSSSVTLKGYVSSDGGETPYETGFYYSASEDCNPSTASKVFAQLSAKEFSADIPLLDRATTYFVRAYALNSAGESVSEVVSVRTLAELPVVETSDVTDITDVRAICGGVIVDDGGETILAKGVVWSTKMNPVVDLTTKTDEGEGSNGFISTITRSSYNATYYVRSYATNSRGTSYGQTIEFTFSDLDIANLPDLSLNGNANCYIVSKCGLYGFPAVKGNSNESVGDVVSVEVLWESFGTSAIPKEGDLINDVTYSNGYVAFSTNDIFREGNAVIAAKDESGSILWSWHIWLTDQPGQCVYVNDAGILMDRNLGATSARPGDVCSLGLHYQWGRKDPFLSSSNISDDISPGSTGTWQSVSFTLSSNTVSYSIEHPMTFIGYNSSNYDWYYMDGETVDNTRWQSQKTIYDPCPAGWRVPDGDIDGIWGKAGFADMSYDDINKGFLFGTDVSTPAIWYPAAGFSYYYAGILKNVGDQGYYWSVTPNWDYHAYSLNLKGANRIWHLLAYRADGYSVRCQKE